MMHDARLGRIGVTLILAVFWVWAIFWLAPELADLLIGVAP